MVALVGSGALSSTSTNSIHSTSLCRSFWAPEKSVDRAGGRNAGLAHHHDGAGAETARQHRNDAAERATALPRVQHLDPGCIAPGVLSGMNR